MRIRSIVAGFVFPFTGLLTVYLAFSLLRLGNLTAGRSELAEDILTFLPSVLGAAASGALLRLFSCTRLAASIGAVFFGVLLSTLHIGWSSRLSDARIAKQIVLIAVASVLVFGLAYPWRKRRRDVV